MPDTAGRRPRLVFFGNERLATGFTTDAPTLRGLIQAGYDIAAVVSNYERSRSRSVRELEIAAVAESHGIPVLLPDRPSDVIDQLRGYGAAAGILVAYGRIVPQSVIDVFPCGIINIHPSLLPLHRGPVPVESVILNGESETGVSIMALAKAMDAGPVYRQVRLPLRGDETKLALTAQLLEMGRDALLGCLPGILDGTLQPQPQDDAAATYDGLLGPQDGILDPAKPAVRLEREVRAYLEWPRSRTVLGGKDVIVTAAHAAPAGEADGREAGSVFATADKRIALVTADGVLIIDRLRPAGKSEMDAGAFLAGNRL